MKDRCAGAEEVARIERGVAVKLKSRTVDLVASRFGFGVQDRPAVSSIFGVNGVGHHADFGNGVRVGNNNSGVERQVVGVNSVHQVVVLALA